MDMENIMIILSNKCALKADFHEANNSLKLNILRRKVEIILPSCEAKYLYISIFLTNQNARNRFAANSSRGPEMNIEKFINCPGLGNLVVGMSGYVIAIIDYITHIYTVYRLSNPMLFTANLFRFSFFSLRESTESKQILVIFIYIVTQHSDDLLSLFGSQ